MKIEYGSNSIITLSGLNEWDGEAVDGAPAPAEVLIPSAVVGSLSSAVVVGLFEFGEAINKQL